MKVCAEKFRTKAVWQFAQGRSKVVALLLVSGGSSTEKVVQAVTIAGSSTPLLAYT
jgi:hypothetical protein